MSSKWTSLWTNLNFFLGSCILLSAMREAHGTAYTALAVILQLCDTRSVSKYLHLLFKVLSGKQCRSSYVQAHQCFILIGPNPSGWHRLCCSAKAFRKRKCVSGVHLIKSFALRPLSSQEWISKFQQLPQYVVLSVCHLKFGPRDGSSPTAVLLLWFAASSMRTGRLKVHIRLTQSQFKVCFLPLFSDNLETHPADSSLLSKRRKLSGGRPGLVHSVPPHRERCVCCWGRGCLDARCAWAADLFWC